MVLRVDVVDAALHGAYGEGTRPRIVAAHADRAGCSTTRSPTSWPPSPHVALLCGRYEGFDDRVHEHLADDEVSIGRYVLAGASCRRWSSPTC